VVIGDRPLFLSGARGNRGQTTISVRSLHRLLLEKLEFAKLRALDAEAFDAAELNPVTGAPAVGEAAHFLASPASPPLLATRAPPR